MADAATTRYAYVKPEVGASADTWGGKLNQNFDDLDKLGGVITTAGSANAYTLTSGLSLGAYVDGQSFDIKLSFSNSGACTINVDGLGAKDLRKNGTVAMANGDLVSGRVHRVHYDGTLFQVTGPVTTSWQPLDATLSAYAAVAWSAGNQFPYLTAADTFSLATITAAALTVLDDTTVAGMCTTLGAAQLSASNIFTGATNTFSSTVPTIFWHESDAGSDEKYSTIRSTAGVLQFRLVNDALNAGVNYATLTRTGTTPLIFEFDNCDLRLETTPASLATNSAGYRGAPPTTHDADYTMALADAGTALDHTSGSAHAWTIPPNASVAYPLGTIIRGRNRGAGVVTFGRGSGVALINESGTDGDRTLAQYKSCCIEKVATNTWYITGAYT